VHPYYQDYYEKFRKKADNALSGTEWHINRPIEEIGELIKESFCAVLYFKDGVSSRRSSFTAFISNGIPVITNRGKYSEELSVIEGKGMFYTENDFHNIEGILRKFDDPEFYKRCHQTLIDFSRPFQYPYIAGEYQKIFKRLRNS
jgi:hypothetical protein